MTKPIVGITMGDPAGSGPEITIKALADPKQYSYCRPIVVGDVKVFEQAKKFVGREDIVIHRCEKVSDALFTPGTIDVLHLDLIEDINKFELAKVSVEGGNAAFQCVKKVIELAMAGEVDAMPCICCCAAMIFPVAALLRVSRWRLVLFCNIWPLAPVGWKAICVSCR